ncbi:hypothetical protein [Rhodocyclus tenuis]|uniref:hypothetical protein n=1 Tax=Rhodocyclus tenuis TaxID=1066 RepID=UPI001291F70D|nr:hypothetical protein [Rhodocyclus tenuis]
MQSAAVDRSGAADMSLPIWPSLLPTPKLPIEIETDDATARTDMEDGAAIVRRVKTMIVTNYAATVDFTREQMQIFEAWHRHYLHDGADWFDMPVASGSGIYRAEARFKKGAIKSKLIAGAVFAVTFEFETRNRPVLSKAALDALINP